MPLRVPPSAGRAAARCTNCSFGSTKTSICHAGLGYIQTIYPSAGNSQSWFLFLSSAFALISSPTESNAPFSRKSSFRLVLSFEMCRSTSSPRYPARQRPHRLISFLNDRPCKSRSELCSRIVSNPVLKANSAEMPLPTEPKFRFKDPISSNKLQFTFPQDV
jgi:hypothetical protein